MATGAELLEVAESHLGEDGERFWDWYFGGGYGNGDDTPWCACFVSWNLHQLGVSCVGLPSAYVPGIQAAAAEAGRALSPEDAAPGDVVIFDWNGNGSGDHVGFCAANHDGWMDTVEGNVSNSVGRRTRYHKNVLMAVRPDYSTPEETKTDTGDDAQEEDEMTFICDYNGEGKLVWFDGTKLHWLDEPDTAEGVRMAYRLSHNGAEIPEFQFGQEGAPWASRFAEAVCDGSEELRKFVADHA